MTKKEYLNTPHEKAEMKQISKAKKAKTEKACDSAMTKLSKMHK